MADTGRGDFADLVCNDCGKQGCLFVHWGPLVPVGEKGSFCGPCFRARGEEARAGKEPRPLNSYLHHRPSGEEIYREWCKSAGVTPSENPEEFQEGFDNWKSFGMLRDEVG